MNREDPDVDLQDAGWTGVRRWWYGPLSLLLALAFCALALEAGAGAFWCFNYQLSFRRPNHPLFAFYPGLKAIDVVAVLRPHLPAH